MTASSVVGGATGVYEQRGIRVSRRRAGVWETQLLSTRQHATRHAFARGDDLVLVVVDYDTETARRRVVAAP